jgi:hypothetical protein
MEFGPVLARRPVCRRPPGLCAEVSFQMIDAWHYDGAVHYVVCWYVHLGDRLLERYGCEGSGGSPLGVWAHFHWA